MSDSTPVLFGTMAQSRSSSLLQLSPTDREENDLLLLFPQRTECLSMLKCTFVQLIPQGLPISSHLFIKFCPAPHSASPDFQEDSGPFFQFAWKYYGSSAVFQCVFSAEPGQFPEDNPQKLPLTHGHPAGHRLESFWLHSNVGRPEDVPSAALSLLPTILCHLSFVSARFSHPSLHRLLGCKILQWG